MTNPQTEARANRVQGMVRSMDQWRNMVPAAVASGSQAQVEYALIDAKTDIEALWSKVEFAATALAAKDAELAEANARAERQWAGWVKEEALRKAAEAQLAEANKALETVKGERDELRQALRKMQLNTDREFSRANAAEAKLAGGEVTAAMVASFTNFIVDRLCAPIEHASDATTSGIDGWNQALRELAHPQNARAALEAALRGDAS